MTQIDPIVQPMPRTTLAVIEGIAARPGLEHVDVAAAYVTSSGAGDLLRRMSGVTGRAWNDLRKRWLTSFDYLRSEPVALRALMSAPSSEVRIHDAEFCLSHSGRPRIPFHPKAFLFQSADREYALAGSGNISRSGLSRGIEAGLAISTSRAGARDETVRAAIQAMRDWFATHWRNAVSLNNALLTRYTTVFESTPHLRDPVVTEDDVASSDTGRGALSSNALQKLRVCRHFWIEAGNITKNRGPGLPGNQLMMRRLSRVFFGFSSDTLPENSPIGQVEIVYGRDVNDYSLTYSDNGMDKLVLPIPGAGGPPAYDNEDLLFEQVAPKRFQLSIGVAGDKAQWLRRSRSIGGDFRMSSGRQWGVF